MKKITETELKNRVNSLREYFTSIDRSVIPDGKGGYTNNNGRPATEEEMKNAKWAYVIGDGTVDGSANMAAAASKPAEPKATVVYDPDEGSVNDSMTNTLNQQMAQNKAEANGVNAAGQNVSIQNPDGSTTNPESGKSSIAPMAAPAFAQAASPAAFQQAIANSAAPAYKGSAGAQQIQSLNPAIKDVNKIYPGQKLKMPDKSTYTVRTGDTLDKIAKGANPAGDAFVVPTPAPAAPAPRPAPSAPAPAASAPAPAAPAPRPAPSAPAPAAPAPKLPAPAPKPAPVTGTGSGGGRGPTAQEFTSDWNNKMKAAQKLGWPDSTKLPPADWAPLGKPVTGKNKMAPDLNEAVTYADDQTLARIVSLSRR